MRILVAYNYYRQRVQGEQAAIDSSVELLKENGHQVAVHVEETVDSDASLLAKGRAALSGIYSHAIKRRMLTRIRGFRPDLVHFHNIYPRLGLSAIAACESAGIPSVISLHNYFLTCPIYKQYRNGHACTDCTPRNTVPCVANNCRGDFVESMVYAGRSAIAAAMGIHNRFHGYIVQSQFSRDLFISHGVPEKRVHLLRNFVGEPTVSEHRPSNAKPYVLFLGRITPEKGIGDVVALANRMPGLSIKVAGGMLGSPVVEWPGNVEFLGQVSPADAQSLLRGASCLLFSSRWFEMCPMVLLEAMRFRTPVVATAIGGIPELITHGERGLLYAPGDIAALQSCISRVLQAGGLREALVENAYRYVLTAHSPQTHYEQLIGVYGRVVVGSQVHG